MASGPMVSMTPMPSSSGICTSSITRSNFWFSIACTAASPSAASTIGPTWQSLRNRSTTRCRAGISSSTTSTRMFSIGGVLNGHLSNPPERQVHLDDGSAARPRMQLETALSIGMQAHDTVPRDCQAKPGANLQCPARRQAGAVVEDTDFQAFVLLCRRYRDVASRCAARYSVADRVFHQRLQQQRWHKRETDLGRYLDVDLQLVAEADLLDLEIVLEKSELLAQRNFVTVLGVERHPQQVAEVLDHRTRELRVALHVRRDG